MKEQNILALFLCTETNEPSYEDWLKYKDNQQISSFISSLSTYIEEIDALLKQHGYTFNEETKAKYFSVICLSLQNKLSPNCVSSFFLRWNYPVLTSAPQWAAVKIAKVTGYDISEPSLKNYRLSHGMTQKEVVASLGMAEASYMNWERKKASPKYEELKKLKEFFSIPDCDMWSFISSFKKSR